MGHPDCKIADLGDRQRIECSAICLRVCAVCFGIEPKLLRRPFGPIGGRSGTCRGELGIADRVAKDLWKQLVYIDLAVSIADLALCSPEAYDYRTRQHERIAPHKNIPRV